MIFLSAALKAPSIAGLIIICGALLLCLALILAAHLKKKKEIDAWVNAVSAIAHGSVNTPLPDFRHTRKLAAPFESLMSGLTDAVQGEFAANERNKLYLGLLQDVQGTYASQDVLQALCERMGPYLMFDRVSVIDDINSDGEPVVLAYWSRDGVPDFTADERTMSALRSRMDKNDGIMSVPAASGGETGLPPDAKSLFVYRIQSSEKGDSVILMENTTRERALTDRDLSVITDVGKLALNVFNKHWMENARADFAASLEEEARKTLKRQEEVANLLTGASSLLEMSEYELAKETLYKAMKLFE